MVGCDSGTVSVAEPAGLGESDGAASPSRQQEPPGTGLWALAMELRDSVSGFRAGWSCLGLLRSQEGRHSGGGETAVPRLCLQEEGHMPAASALGRMIQLQGGPPPRQGLEEGEAAGGSGAQGLGVRSLLTPEMNQILRLELALPLG